MIGKLLYVAHTRPDIALVVGIVARFLGKPRENHMMAIKIISRYLKGTEDYGLWYKLGGNMDHYFLVKNWYLGQARSKIAHPNPQQK